MVSVERKVNIEVEGHKLAISNESARTLYAELGKLFGTTGPTYADLQDWRLRQIGPIKYGDKTGDNPVIPYVTCS